MWQAVGILYIYAYFRNILISKWVHLCMPQYSCVVWAVSLLWRISVAALYSRGGPPRTCKSRHAQLRLARSRRPRQNGTQRGKLLYVEPAIPFLTQHLILYTLRGLDWILIESRLATSHVSNSHETARPSSDLVTSLSCGWWKCFVAPWESVPQSVPEKHFSAAAIRLPGEWGRDACLGLFRGGKEEAKMLWIRLACTAHSCCCC